MAIFQRIFKSLLISVSSSAVGISSCFIHSETYPNFIEYSEIYTKTLNFLLQNLISSLPFPASTSPTFASLIFLSQFRRDKGKHHNFKVFHKQFGTIAVDYERGKQNVSKLTDYLKERFFFLSLYRRLRRTIDL